MAEAKRAGSATGTVTRSLGSVVRERAIDEESGRIWFRFSTNRSVRDPYIIEPEAWRKYMDRFMQNPVFLATHQYHGKLSDIVLGKVVDWEIDSEGLVGQVEFAREENPEAKTVFDLYRSGYLNAVSVGWIIHKQEPIEDTDKIRVLEAELLEVSAVPVPADPYALAMRAPEEMWAAVRSFTHDIEQTEQRPGWEETENEIRYRVRDPKLFDPDSFRTKKLDVKDKGDVRLILGKLKNPKPEEKGKMILQALRFEKEAGWTLKEAKEWYEKHKDSLRSFDQSAKQPPEHSLTMGDFESDQDVVYEREGKVLSAKNRKLVEAAIEAMNQAIEALRELLAAAEGEKEAETEKAREPIESADWQTINKLAEVERDLAGDKLWGVVERIAVQGSLADDRN